MSMFKQFGKSFPVITLFCLLTGVIFLPMNAFAAGDLVIADFDTGDKPNNVGGDFGSWDKDPNDETQGCQMAFINSDALGDPYGYAIQMDYDVESPNPAYNGFWMKLNALDATSYNALMFYIKGDPQVGFSQRVKIELKDGSNTPSPYLLSGLTGEWQQVTIPLDKFRKVTDWKALNEFVVVFDDLNSNPKTGRVLIDHVGFTTVP